MPLIPRLFAVSHARCAIPLIFSVMLPVAPVIAASQPRDEAAIAEVAAKKRMEAKAAWWGFDPADATAALQSAIRSGARKVIVENFGSPWIVDRIQLASDQEIVFEKGVVVQAKRGAFHGKTDSLFSASGLANVTLTGPGATLKMWKADYTTPDYTKSEWRHTLALRSCTNVQVSGLTIEDSGGDGIYLGAARRGETNKGVTIRDVILRNHHRQGISVISAEDLLIERCSLLDTGGTAPQAGIDFEPNDPEDRLVNIVMRDCRSDGNRGDAYDFYLPQLRRTTQPISIRLERCTSKGGRRSVAFATGNAEADAVGGRVEFVDCRFDDAEGEAIEIRRKPANGCAVRFVNCTITNPAAQQPTLAPISIGSVPGNSEDIGGVEFVDCTIIDSLARRPLAYVDGTGELRLINVSGTLTVTHAGKTERYELGRALLDQWFPTPPVRRFPKVKTDLAALVPVAPTTAESAVHARVRDMADWALWAEAGREVSFTIRIQPVGKVDVRPVPVTCLSPAGQPVLLRGAGSDAERTYAFRASETGAYHLSATPGSLSAELTRANAPATLLGAGRPIHFVYTSGDFYVWVPQGARAFAIKVVGGGGTERVKASLFDPAGKLVEQKDDIDRANQFAVDLQTPSAGAAWKLTIARPTHGVLEDYTVELQAIPALLATSPATLLRAK